MTLQGVEPITERDTERHQFEEQPRLTVAEALRLPALCGPRELAALWGISVSAVYKLNHKGAYDRFKVTPAIGPRCYSGVLLGRYLSGEPLIVPTFGRKR